MKFIDEYRQSDLARKFADKIAPMTDKPLKPMEVCGGHYGLSSHLVYGLTTDLVRRSVRRLL